jgi:cephalosporin hydroxylase
MFPFWNVAIAPILEAAQVRRLVEIGALRGENTEQIIERLGPETELHVIDPAPDFDPAEHTARFGGQYVFHQDLSLNVLGDLGPVDAALIDGDHNWYTVYHELQLLRETARANDAELPVLILHDVGWPYGHRDLYYAPEDIPEEFRHPWQRLGMRPGRSELVETGGLNPTMCNATHEGGPRNGVRCALDDFLAEHDRPYKLFVTPIYFGLAVVVEEERLARQPALKAELDRLGGIQGKSQLLFLAEQVRINAMMFQHRVYYQGQDRVARAVDRHLRTVKAALLDEHYLDHEARLAHYHDRTTAGRPVDVRQLRDPSRINPGAYQGLVRQRLGPAGPDRGAGSFLPFTDMGRHRLDHLHASLDAVLEAEVPGDLLEVGCGRGGGAIFMRTWLEAHEIGDRAVWVADAFRASPEPDLRPTLPPNGAAGFRADLNLVRDGFARFEVLDAKVHFLVGRPTEMLARTDLGRLAGVRIGRSAAADTPEVLRAVLPRVSPGGFVIVEDDGPPANLHEIEAVLAEHGVVAGGHAVDDRTWAWHLPVEASGRPLPEPRRPQSPTSTGAEATDQLDLTVVAVFYNMRREAARTLRSLSRSYQEGIEQLRYEVLVLDNGSAPDQRLDEDFVSSFGPEFRLIDMGDDAEPSPVAALNRGVREGQGQAFALMIDGAHVLTPGVLRFGVQGLRAHAPAIVATQQWYTGPGQQGDAMDDGYDQAFEDRLFDQIDWPQAGYRLFEIGHFIGDRDWLDGMWESNCLFASRAQLEQVGAFDEHFSIAGGGYANLELYERLGSAADTTVVSIIGEGSFHQVHGGTTTNQIDPEVRRARVFGYGQEYAQLRGRPFAGPGKPIHYVGRITTPAARRTKPRRLSAETFLDAAAPGGVDGPPTTPVPIPEDLRWSFTEAAYRSMGWQHTRWMGRPIETAPTDLVAYQDLITRIRPDWIVETGTGDGVRTHFLASMCDLIDHGQVVTVDPDDQPERPTHPRITQVIGRPHHDDTAQEVRAIVGDGRALVILGSRADRHKTQTEFGAYAPLVPVGSYVVLADTVVNGHPVWPGFGPGPAEAGKQILSMNGNFVVDPELELYALSFNPAGYLRRVT